MYIIVVYDIGDVKVQDHVRAFLRKFLIHVQLSVFEGEVSPAQLTEILHFFKKLKYEGNDGVIVYILRDQNKVKKEIFGSTFSPVSPDEPAFFV